MKNLKKALLLFLCAVLLIAGSVLGTLAYLTDNDAVTNTFTVGKVVITLDEADVKTDGTLELDDAGNALARVKTNEYHLMPGHTYIKDPIIHVDEESENCFLYVKVVNGLSVIEDATTIEDQMKNNGWTLVAGETDVYYYKEVCAAGYNIPVFQQFKIKGDVEDLSAYVTEPNGVKITVEAYAVQHDGFASAQAAWDATFGADT